MNIKSEVIDECRWQDSRWYVQKSSMEGMAGGSMYKRGMQGCDSGQWSEEGLMG